jgi:5-methylthioadenosine/S-adenosylhomocysteine deaminase
MIAAHCVQLTPGEPQTLADHGVSVAHCPISNANLGCGIAPLEALWDARVRVGLGTDSPASAGRYDLRAEARACGLVLASRACRAVHRAAGVAITSRDLVRLMTLGGAEALGRDHEIGSLTPGKRADVVAIDVPAAVVGADPHVAILDPGAVITDVWIDGIRRFGGGRVTGVDEAAIDARARRARAGVC